MCTLLVSYIVVLGGKECMLQNVWVMCTLLGLFIIVFEVNKLIS
jgi:hypothetical protein